MRRLRSDSKRHTKKDYQEDDEYNVSIPHTLENCSRQEHEKRR
jgi:hypothetical protein